MRSNRRLRRERRTIAVMIAMYCRSHHGDNARTAALCSECAELQSYALRRLETCRFKERKPTCAKCTVHCYAPVMRQRVRAVMRFAGPRMTYRHPIMALWHLLDGLRSSPTFPEPRSPKTTPT